MTKTLEMVFRNTEGKEVSLQLTDPRDDLTLAQVTTVMQDIIAKNIFTSKGGDLVSVADAQVRVRDVIDLV